MIHMLQSYVCDEWSSGKNPQHRLHNPTTETCIATCSTDNLDFGKALNYARTQGAPALGNMSFSQRGKLLLAMSQAIYEHREALLEIETLNGGNTRSDGKFDVDGATGTLAYYGKLGSKMGDSANLLADDADTIALSRNPRWVGRHVWAPRQGVAIHINAFNFPAWGFAEKAACAILAGMPVVTKPASSTAMVTARIIEIIVNANVLPRGVLSCITGSAGDMLDHIAWQDVIAFTGSSDTGRFIRGHHKVLDHNVRVNVEADSLNTAILCADVEPESETFDLFVREVARDITQKAGQKCTAIRRIVVPSNLLEPVKSALREQLEDVVVGNPAHKEVKMGPLTTRPQLDAALLGLSQLEPCTERVLGSRARGSLVGVDDECGYFMSPVLLQAKDSCAPAIHEREVFGPVATLLPYDGTAEQAAHITSLGGGSLVCSVYSNNNRELQTHAHALAPFNGRIHLANDKIAELSAGPGTVMPQLMHGGPGRAGGGIELGGLRGLELYMQRTALQGYAPLLEKITG